MRYTSAVAQTSSEVVTVAVTTMVWASWSRGCVDRAGDIPTSVVPGNLGMGEPVGQQNTLNGERDIAKHLGEEKCMEKSAVMSRKSRIQRQVAVGFAAHLVIF